MNEPNENPQPSPGLELSEARMTTYELTSLAFDAIKMLLLTAILSVLSPNCPPAASGDPQDDGSHDLGETQP